jgi:AcrR family transcriptional regulator
MEKIRPTTYDAILEAAFQTYNVNPTASLAEVAQAAGVGRATLHRHFSGRAALMQALSKRATQELDDAVEAITNNALSYTEGLRLSLVAIIPLGDRQWFLSHEYEDADPEKRAAETAELIDAIDHAKTEGTFDPHVPSPWIATLYENVIYAAWTLVRTGEATPNQAADIAWRTLTSGLQGDAK